MGENKREFKLGDPLYLTYPDGIWKGFYVGPTRSDGSMRIVYHHHSFKSGPEFDWVEGNQVSIRKPDVPQATLQQPPVGPKITGVPLDLGPATIDDRQIVLGVMARHLDHSAVIQNGVTLIQSITKASGKPT